MTYEQEMNGEFVRQQLTKALGLGNGGTAMSVEILVTKIKELETAHEVAIDQLYLLAPWGKFPDDDKETNFGRACICGAPLRAGTRHTHVCEPGAKEVRAAAARYQLETPKLREEVAALTAKLREVEMGAGAPTLRSAAKVLRERAAKNRAEGPAWFTYSLAQRNAADWLDHVSAENSCRQCHGFGRPDRPDQPQCSSCGSVPPEGA